MHVLEGGGRILGTGGTDGTVKVWDLEHQFYTHNFRFDLFLFACTVWSLLIVELGLCCYSVFSFMPVLY